MNYFSIPADFKKETIDEYSRLNKKYQNGKVIETYGSITIGNSMESGRAINHLPKIDLLDLKEYIEYSKRVGIEYNYTINAPHLGNKEFTEKGIKEIKSFLGGLYEAGVRSLTIALPSLVELIKLSGFDFKIKSSTLCQITNANKALAYKRMGVDRIVVDESINRDFKNLKRISEVFGDKVEVIINPICHKNCIYRMFHYNQVGGDSVGYANDVSVNFYEHKCVLQRYENISELLKLTWIRPEDLKYYRSVGVNYFKLQGRHTFDRGGDPIRTVEAYFKEDFDGNIMDLLSMFTSLNSFNVVLDNKKMDGFIEPFYKNEDFCKNDCSVCTYCSDFTKKCIDLEESNKVIALAKEFYNSYDQFKNKLQTSSGDVKVKDIEQNNIKDVEFNL